MAIFLVKCIFNHNDEYFKIKRLIYESIGVNINTNVCIFMNWGCLQ